MSNNINGKYLFDEIQKTISKKYNKEKEEIKPHMRYTGNIVIDMPRKRGQYHGSAYVIQPVNCYNIGGDAVTSMDSKDANIS